MVLLLLGFVVRCVWLMSRRKSLLFLGRNVVAVALALSPGLLRSVHSEPPVICPEVCPEDGLPDC